MRSSRGNYICCEIVKEKTIPGKQSDPEHKQCWGNNQIIFQVKSQIYGHQKSVVLAQKWTCRSVSQDGRQNLSTCNDGHVIFDEDDRSTRGTIACSIQGA